MGSAVVIGPLRLAVDRRLAVLCTAVFRGETSLAGRLRFAGVVSAATGRQRRGRFQATVRAGPGVRVTVT